MKAQGWIAGATLSFLCLSSLLYAQRVEIPEGTPVQVRLKADLLGSQVEEASRVDFVVAQPVVIHGLVAIPVGTVAWGAVQSVKKDKVIKFDIEGARLPDLTVIKLRSIPEKSKKAGKNQLKVDSKLGDEVGARKGREFLAYVDEDVTVQAAGAAPTPAARPATPAPAAAEAAPAVTAPTVAAPALPTAAPVPTARPVTPAPAPAEAAPAATAPAVAAPAPQTPVPPTAAPAPAPVVTREAIELDCFSDPSGADILLDGDFRGTTPSILKIPPGKHHLEYQLSGYKSYSDDLDLKPGTGSRMIRQPLQKKE